MSAPRLPVTLLTGFLGAGKTTLLNAVLADPFAGRIAVIVNEFGEAGLDHDLIEAVDEDVVLMQSGCLCCSIREDLARTIAGLLARREDGTAAFGRIVIETTGLADPGPILQTLLVDPLLAGMVRMDGVVTVADAVNGPATLDAQFEAVSQAAMADLIVLSKTDLATPAQLFAFETRLRDVNPAARLLRAVRGDGLAGRLWGLSGLRPDVTLPEAMTWAGGAGPLDNLSGLLPAKHPLATPHDARIGSASIVLDEPIPDAIFDIWLDGLIALRGPDILRIKGIVFLEDIDTPFVFHGVQHVFDPPVPLLRWSGGPRRSRIVIIARDIARPELQRSLAILRTQLPRAGATPSTDKVSSP